MDICNAKLAPKLRLQLSYEYAQSIYTTLQTFHCSARVHSPCARPVSSNQRSASAYLGSIDLHHCTKESRGAALLAAATATSAMPGGCPGAKLAARFQYLGALDKDSQLRKLNSHVPRTEKRLCCLLVESICPIKSHVLLCFDSLGLGTNSVC